MYKFFSGSIKLLTKRQNRMIYLNMWLEVLLTSMLTTMTALGPENIQTPTMREKVWWGWVGGGIQLYNCKMYTKASGIMAVC